MAEWFAVNMPDIDFQDIYYYLRPKGEQVDEWDQLPEEMKDLREARHPRGRAQVPRRRHRAVRVRSRVPQEPDGSREQGILFCDMDTALREYPELVKQYFGTVIPPGDNTASASSARCFSWSRS